MLLPDERLCLRKVSRKNVYRSFYKIFFLNVTQPKQQRHLLEIESLSMLDRLNTVDDFSVHIHFIFNTIFESYKRNNEFINF